jgi:hypothetical protein
VWRIEFDLFQGPSRDTLLTWISFITDVFELLASHGELLFGIYLPICVVVRLDRVPRILSRTRSLGLTVKVAITTIRSMVPNCPFSSRIVMIRWPLNGQLGSIMRLRLPIAP